MQTLSMIVLLCCLGALTCDALRVATTPGPVVSNGDQPIALRYCSSSSSCGRGNYCQFSAGSCGGVGTCRQTPVACTKEYQPVCGCDGKTYGNKCAASAAGVSVVASGACPTRCNDNSGCAANEFCKKPAGSCSFQGICTPKPQVCTLIYQLVCGCDGKEYGNECAANGAGTSVARTGGCDGSCSLDSDCDTSLREYCAYPAGQCGGRGTCTVPAQVCTMVYAPVCGCDGATYSSACMASGNSESIRSTGECPAPAVTAPSVTSS